MPTLNLLLAGLAASFGSFCLGASIGWSAPIEKPATDGEFGFSITSTEFSWVGSLLTLGAATVCVPIGFLISLIGRKQTMLALVPPYILAWIMIIFSKNVYMLYVGRFVLGMCGGAFCVTAPMYTTEIADIESRGLLGTFFQLLIVHGVLYGFVVGAFCKYNIINIACGILPIVFLVIFVCMPESPVYLSQKGKSEQAQKSLKWLRGKDADVSGELSQIQSSGAKSEESVVKLLFRKVTLKGLGISIALMLFQQLTGINAIIFYSTTIFEETGTGLKPSISTIIIGSMMVLATYVSVLLVDKAGRRILLALSALFMGISCFVMGLYFQLKQNNESSVKSLGWLPITSICVFIIFFSFGFGPVPWLIMAELFSEDIKGVAGSISGTTNWTCAFIVTKTFPLIKDAIGPGPTFWIFTGVAGVAVLFVIILVPETKGKTLDEIQAELGG